MPICALNVGVLQKRRRRQDVVGIVGRIRKELLMHHREQVCPRQPAHHRVMIRRDRPGFELYTNSACTAGPSSFPDP